MTFLVAASRPVAFFVATFFFAADFFLGAAFFFGAAFFLLAAFLSVVFFTGAVGVAVVGAEAALKLTGPSWIAACIAAACVSNIAITLFLFYKN